MPYYSPSTNGFYDAACHGPPRRINAKGKDLGPNPASSMPADVIAITDDQWAALMMAQARGQVIQPGADGRPSVADRGAPVINRTWARLQRHARRALAESDGVLLQCLEDGLAVPRAWAAYRQALRVIIGAPDGDPAVGLPSPPGL